MKNYNIGVVMFLVNSFKDIADNYGRTNKAVEIYKKQVESMIQHGQINRADMNIAYEILGISNTNNVKWNITDTKIYQFTSTMNLIIEARDDKYRIAVVNRLVNNKSISELVGNEIKRIYA